MVSPYLRLVLCLKYTLFSSLILTYVDSASQHFFLSNLSIWHQSLWNSKVSRYHEETLNSPYHMPFHSLTSEQCHFLCFCTLHGESHGQQPHFLK
jgi:hypothetical protein